MLKKIVENLIAEPKRWLRIALCLLTVVVVSIGGALVDDYVIIDGNKQYNITVYANSAEDVLNAAGIELKDGDLYSLSKDNNDKIITVDRTYSQIITLDTKLAASEITQNVISYTDGIIKGSTEDVVLDEDDGTLNVKDFSVSYQYVKVTKTIKHGYKTVKSRDLEKGKTKITEGKNGKKEVVYLKRISFDKILLDPNLKEGEYRLLTQEEIEMEQAMQQNEEAIVEE